MSKLRVGILGIGSIAVKHAQALRQLDQEAELVACCGREQEKTRAFAAEYAAPGALLFTQHAEMFDRAALDVVLVCLPPFAHTDEVERAAERGIHLLVEKPIALDSLAVQSSVSGLSVALQ